MAARNRAFKKSRGLPALRPESRTEAETGLPTGDSPQLERMAAKLDKKARKEEKKLFEEQRREALEKATQTALEARQALEEAEQQHRQREGVLQRELGQSSEPVESQGLLEKFQAGISKTRSGISQGLGRLLLGKKELSQDILAGLEELLLSSDIGPVTTARLLEMVRQQVSRKQLRDPAKLQQVLGEEVLNLMDRAYQPEQVADIPPTVILFIGVNGTGKTTTIGKLAALLKGQGKKVLLAAGDTFRAAAAEQLEGWARRADCTLFAKEPGADPSGVVYQAVQKAIAEHYDVVLCDTAGRLHTKINLMEELKKIKRVIGKLLPAAPHETYLVLDGNTGQNAVFQARDFHQAIGVTGLIITKLDGTARGGVVVGIVNEFDLPIRYVGLGEQVEDLRPFDPGLFAKSLFD